jgi:tetratricopeptide (TPR) repeat protein
MKFRKSILLLTALVSVSLPLMGCDSPEQKLARHIRRGVELVEDGELKKARIEFKNAAKLKPTEAEPYYRIGMIDEREGDLRNAFGNYLAAERQNPNFYPAVLKIAQYYLAAEQYDEARKRIDSALANEPNNAEAHAIAAALLLREKKLDEAEKEALTSLEKDPKSVSGCSALTGVYSAKNELDKAVAAVNNGIAHNPENLALLLLRVMLYENAKDMPKVAESYKPIFKLKPEEVQFRKDLAGLYVKAGKMDEAEQSLREGVKELPANWGLKHQLVLFLNQYRGLEAAEAEAKALMQADPSRDEPYFWLADLYGASNATDKAVTLLNQIVERGEYSPAALNARTLLARISIKKGEQDSAQKLVATVLEKQPDNRAALLMRSTMTFQNGDYQSAVSDLRNIIRNSPKDVAALQLLGETYMMQGHSDLAIDTMKKLAEIDPMNWAARVRLAQMVQMGGDTKQAMDLISVITKAAPDYAIGWEAAARIAIEAKQWLPAQEAIRRLEQIEGQHLTAVFLEGLLLEQTGKASEALPKYGAVIDPDPSTPLAGYALGQLIGVYQRLGKLDEAAKYLEGLRGDVPAVAVLLGKCYAALGKPAEAATAFDKVVAGEAPLVDAYLGRAELYMKEHKPEPALDVLKKAMRLIPGDFRAALVAAGILGETGKHADAIAIYEDILRRNPSVDVAANNLAEIIADYQAGDAVALEKARKIAERFGGSSNPMLLDTLGWVYFKQGNLSMAQTIMERAISQAQGRELPAQIHYHYGAVLMKAGALDKAKEQLKRAVANGASYPGVEDAKKLLGSD